MHHNSVVRCFRFLPIIKAKMCVPPFLAKSPPIISISGSTHLRVAGDAWIPFNDAELVNQRDDLGPAPATPRRQRANLRPGL